MVTDEQLKEVIEKSTNAKYIGKLRVSYEDGYYLLKLYLDQDERPRITIGMETDNDQEFIDYICEEMRIRKMNMVKFWRLDKLDF